MSAPSCRQGRRDGRGSGEDDWSYLQEDAASCSWALVSVILFRSDSQLTRVRYNRHGPGSKATQLRQYIRLTGLGSAVFNEYRDAVERIQTMFTHEAGEHNLTRLKECMYEGEYAVDMHTRYLTERRLVEAEKHVPFTQDIDPNNALEEARGGNLIRTTDNVVQYSTKNVVTKQ